MDPSVSTKWWGPGPFLRPLKSIKCSVYRARTHPFCRRKWGGGSLSKLVLHNLPPHLPRVVLHGCRAPFSQTFPSAIRLLAFANPMCWLVFHFFPVILSFTVLHVSSTHPLFGRLPMLFAGRGISKTARSGQVKRARQRRAVFGRRHKSRVEPVRQTNGGPHWAQA